MKTIDKRVLDGYNAGIERNRLREGLGLIEFARTKELLTEKLPKPPAVIYDIGGGYGEYAWWLASLGYTVHLFDLSPTNIAMSAELAEEYPGVSLSASEVCDAREVPREDKSADAVLLMGPLYHIMERNERITAIREAERLLKDDGILFTAAITPYAALLHRITVYGKPDRRLEDDGFMSMIAHTLETGDHINSGIYGGMGNSHFHRADELKKELSDGGFSITEIHGVVGGAWLVPDIDEMWKDEISREAILRTVRLMDGYDDILGLSTHYLGISRK